jgi:hypothetical protein
MTKTNTVYLPLDAKDHVEKAFGEDAPLRLLCSLELETKLSDGGGSIVVKLTYDTEFEGLVWHRFFFAGFDYAKYILCY